MRVPSSPTPTSDHPQGGSEALPSAGAYARVAVALPVRTLFTYGVPAALDAVLVPGHAVAVPVGRRLITGYVIERTDTPGVDPGKVRPIRELRDPKPVFESRQLRFFEWIAGYYLAGLGEVIATALPSALKVRSLTTWHATDEGMDALAAGALEGESDEVLREVVARPGLTRRGIARRLRELLEPDETGRALNQLSRKGWVRSEQTLRGTGGSVKVVRLLPLSEAPQGGRLGTRQRAVLSDLESNEGVMDLAALVAVQGPYARQAVRTLVERGRVSVELREQRDPVVLGELPEERMPPTLTPAQARAVEKILGAPRTWLLHGVTGSGKTEVYLRAASEILDRGKQVLVLVPEIGLTPLLTGRFRARFGDAVAVLHSGLTGAQRLAEWRRIRAGEARVAIGARSALFAPFADLGLLVVDEEHDDSYKQDDGVRYSARDLAVVLGSQSSCPVVLGSATPSLESFENAVAGRYGLIELLERPTPRPVPPIEPIDMNRLDRTEGRLPLFSPRVLDALTECFASDGQAIVLYNRRGYATTVQCHDCGGSYTCPSCGVGLVLHLSQRTLTCHYCGFHRKYDESCPACQGELAVTGRGTERVEEALAEAFPDVGITRMDADTTASRGSHHRLLDSFRRGESRLLVGTQIVAKGHDFPNVHLAVVVGSDNALLMPDFRASERTHALLTQLAGRAGRGSVAGRVLVQTHQPDHFVFGVLNDARAFRDEEIRQRELLYYPPFTRLVLLRLESSHRDAALGAAIDLARRLREGLPRDRSGPAHVLGPVAAAMPRLVGRWRFQVLLRGPRTAAFREWLQSKDLRVSRRRGVRLVIDVDPRHLM